LGAADAVPTRADTLLMTALRATEIAAGGHGFDRSADTALLQVALTAPRKAIAERVYANPARYVGNNPLNVARIQAIEFLDDFTAEAAYTPNHLTIYARMAAIGGLAQNQDSFNAMFKTVTAFFEAGALVQARIPHITQGQVEHVVAVRANENLAKAVAWKIAKEEVAHNGYVPAGLAVFTGMEGGGVDYLFDIVAPIEAISGPYTAAARKVVQQIRVAPLTVPNTAAGDKVYAPGNVVFFDDIQLDIAVATNVTFDAPDGDINNR